MITDFNYFLSDWSEKEIEGRLFDRIFYFDRTPISWAYKPIIYSNLLPKYFPSVQDVLNKRSKSFSLPLFSFIFRKGSILLINLKRHISKSVNLKSNSNSNLNSDFKKQSENVLFIQFTNQGYKTKNGKETIKNLEKVIENLDTSSGMSPFLLSVDPLSLFSFNKIRNAKNGIYGYHNQSINSKAKYFASKMSKRWKSISKKEKERLFRYEGKSLWKYAMPTFNFLYSKDYLYVLGYHYELCKRILKEENISKIVLTSQNNLFEKCMIAAGKEYNIPVLIIQHGIGLGTFKSVDVIQREKFAVWGECFQKSLQDLGVNEKQICITGNLALDNNKNNQNNNDHLSTKQFPEEHILIATSCYIEDRFIQKKEYFKMIEKVLKDVNSLNQKTILKIHPRERHLEEYKEIIQRINSKIIFSTSTSKKEYRELLEKSSVVITFGSSMTLEATAINKRNIIIDPFSDNSPLKLLSNHIGSVKIIPWKENIAQEISHLLKSEQNYKNDIKKLFYKLDGKAHERVVEEIYKL